MSVLLKESPFGLVSSKELAKQIEAQKRAKHKLPSWFKSNQILYPNKLNIEQCSSEVTAAYKASLVSGTSLLDATGGFGVDSFFFSKKITKVVHCEINEELSLIASHNFKVLGRTNIRILPKNGIQFLEHAKEHFDWIYLDPSRRNEHKGKVFQFSDCSPNVLDHLELLLLKSKFVLLKTSPLLDLSLGIEQLRFTTDIHIVAVNNEVKELLWVLHKNEDHKLRIHTINLNQNKEDEVFDFKWGEEGHSRLKPGAPQNYLYEPNAALLKSGAFKLVTQRYPVLKLHEHTHLYTSNDLISFPGRIFKIDSTHVYSKKNMKALRIGKANITTRNFPKTVAEIRKQFNIKDGGSRYIFMAKNHENALIVLICSKVP